MDSIIVTGNGAVSGQIPIAGAKNAALTLMPAALLTDQPVTLTNVPRLSDIKTTNELLASLGTDVTMADDDQTITLHTPEITNDVVLLRCHCQVVARLVLGRLICICAG